MASPRSARSTRSVSDFAELVHRPSTGAGRLQRGVELVVSLIEGCDHAGVTVLTPAFVETIAASDEVVRRGDAWQHELSEGPGLDSVRHRTTVVSQDLQVDPRWRTWGPLVVGGLGVRCTMSVPFDQHGGRDVESLTLYADRPGVWDRERRRLVTTLAGQLGLAAADARLLDDGRRALESQVGLGQAQGIVMERFGLSPGEAYDHLQRLARGTRMELVHLAERIVETREVPTLPDPARAR